MAIAQIDAPVAPDTPERDRQYREWLDRVAAIRQDLRTRLQTLPGAIYGQRVQLAELARDGANQVTNLKLRIADANKALTKEDARLIGDASMLPKDQASNAEARKAWLETQRLEDRQFRAAEAGVLAAQHDLDEFEADHQFNINKAKAELMRLEQEREATHAEVQLLFHDEFVFSGNGQQPD